MRRSFVFVVLFGAVWLAASACARAGSGQLEPDGRGGTTHAASPSPPVPLSSRGFPLGDLTISPGPRTPGDPGPTGGPGGSGGSGGLHLTVEVADTPEASERGLMGVEHLPDDRGMVFLWDEPSNVAFWMKDTLVPLDIAFWDQKGRIFDIQQMQPCRVLEGQLAESVCPVYQPSGPYVGAVEVNLGLLARNGVQPGASVELVRR